MKASGALQSNEIDCQKIFSLNVALENKFKYFPTNTYQFSSLQISSLNYHDRLYGRQQQALICGSDDSLIHVQP